MLPDYDLELKTTSNVEDVPALNFNANSNFTELVAYINAIKDAVADIVVEPNSGLNESQVRTVIVSTRIRRLIDGNKHTAVGLVTYNPDTVNEYAVTYSVTAEGKHQYVISNAYNTEASFVVAKSEDGVIEYPHIQTSGNSIIVVYTNKLSVSSKKFVTIF
jgi:hypothetical protein